MRLHSLLSQFTRQLLEGACCSPVYPPLTSLPSPPPLSIPQAIKEGRKRFIFMGQEIRLIASCGIFVTMNPGYAGRSELPDNLKVG